MTQAVLEEQEWRGEDVSLADVERELGRLRDSGDPDRAPDLRTSVMTHTAWVPRAWLDAARGTLAGLAEMHPSRTIILVPDPDAGRDSIDAVLSVQRFPLEGEQANVCAEVIELHLCGKRSKAPASILEPLLVADLPVFSRWRGRPSFGEDEFEQILGVVDRLIVDSSEWPDVPDAYSELERCFSETAASDIAWCRSRAWRGSLASMWPGIADAKKLTVTGAKADALLLTGWLRARLGRKVRLQHEEADELERVEVDGVSVPVPRGERPTSSELLSAELDQFGRDRLYEAAVAASSPG